MKDRSLTQSSVCVIRAMRDIHWTRASGVRLLITPSVQPVCPACHHNLLSLWNMKEKLHNASISSLSQIKSWMAERSATVSQDDHNLDECTGITFYTVAALVVFLFPWHFPSLPCSSLMCEFTYFYTLTPQLAPSPTDACCFCVLSVVKARCSKQMCVCLCE